MLRSWRKRPTMTSKKFWKRDWTKPKSYQRNDSRILDSTHRVMQFIGLDSSKPFVMDVDSAVECCDFKSHQIIGTGDWVAERFLSQESTAGTEDVWGR